MRELLVIFAESDKPVYVCETEEQVEQWLNEHPGDYYVKDYIPKVYLTKPVPHA